MWVSTTIASRWTRAARGETAAADIAAAAIAARSAAERLTGLLRLLESRRHRDVGRADVGRHLQHLVVERHEGRALPGRGVAARLLVDHLLGEAPREPADAPFGRLLVVVAALLRFLRHLLLRFHGVDRRGR